MGARTSSARLRAGGSAGSLALLAAPTAFPAPTATERPRNKRCERALARPGTAISSSATKRTKEIHMSVTTENSAGAAAIRPFRVAIPDEAIADLRRRLAATRLPSKELVADRDRDP